MISQGENEEESLKNVKEAIELAIEEYEPQARKDEDKLMLAVF